MTMKNKKTAKQLKKQEKREHRGTIAVYARCDCGCCTATMRFKNKAAVEEAFAKAGLVNSATIVDDKGVVHEGIDTFYGFSLYSE
jgi:hypothetical protein